MGMRTIFSFWLAWLFLFQCSFAQQTQSTIESVKVSVKKIEAITFNDTSLDEKVLSQTEREAVVVRTSAPNPLVRAYADKNPWPPVPLHKVSDGEFLLVGPPGSRWSIEILAITENGWWTETLKATIGTLGPQPPPDEPDQPDEPDEPVTDHSKLIDGIKAFRFKGHDLPLIEMEPSFAKGLADAYERVIDSVRAATTQEASKKIVETSLTEFGQKTPSRNNWNQFRRMAIDEYIAENPPSNSSEYAEILNAIVKGLRNE